jgi:hypothetical protein
MLNRPVVQGRQDLIHARLRQVTPAAGGFTLSGRSSAECVMFHVDAASLLTQFTAAKRPSATIL